MRILKNTFSKAGPILGLILLSAFVTSGARAEPYRHTHVFSMEDVIGGFNGQTFAENPGIICIATACNGELPFTDKSGVTLYPIDSDFGFTVTDFVGAEERERDGVYEEGWVGNITESPEFEGVVPNNAGVYGLMLSSPETVSFQTGSPLGTWCAGIGGIDVKCSAEQYGAMEHVLTCNETVPYFYPADLDYCKELDDTLSIGDTVVVRDSDDVKNLPPNESDLINIAVGSDYSVSLKDDGKALYRWGTIHKRPTDIRLYAKMDLPDAWKANPDKVFRVTKAQLILRHKITNNPNDQIRPEDLENEAATGRLPEYQVQEGKWLSTMECYEGDGDAIPAGTLLKDPASANSSALSADLREGFSNAWFTTIQRDPFESDPARDALGRYLRDQNGEFYLFRSGPRWRLKSKMFGQNIPGLEIPKIECEPPPYKKGEEQIKYVVETYTTTTINLLDWEEGEESPLATSKGWMGDSYEIGEYPHVSINGLKMTDDFDLAVYIKGERKPATLYNAELVLEHEEEGGLP